MLHHKLTQTERDLIVELCRIALNERNGLPTARATAYDEFHADDWERCESIVTKLDQVDLDLLPNFEDD